MIVRPSCAPPRPRSYHGVHRVLICSASIIGLFSQLAALPAHAEAPPVLPSGGSVSAGSVTIATSGNAVTVRQSSSRAVVNWQNFSIGSGAAVNFEGQGNAAILNRVTGPNASEINGTLRAAGTSVYIVNQNGITIGPEGTISSSEGFVASTLAISDAAFMAGGVLEFRGAGGKIQNSGSISSNGIVGLLGAEIANDGLISVRKGKIALGGGEAVTLDPSGDGFLQVLLPTGTVSSSGRLEADGGRIVLSANKVNTFSPVFVPATIRADRLEGQNGSIELIAADAAKTVVLSSGPVAVASPGVIVSNAVTSASGGNIMMSGPQVVVTGRLSADAGGTVAIDGTRQVTIAAPITANATQGSGTDGGRIDLTGAAVQVNSSLSAKAGDGGRGGLVRIGSAFAFGAADDGSEKFARFSGRYGNLPALRTAAEVKVGSGSDINVAGGTGGTLVVAGNTVSFAGVWDAGANGAVSIASSTLVNGLPPDALNLSLDGLALRAPSANHFRTDWLVVGSVNLLITDPIDQGQDDQVIAGLTAQLTFAPERESFARRFSGIVPGVTSPLYSRIGTDWLNRMLLSSRRVQVEASDTMYLKGNLLADHAAPRLDAFSLLAGQAVYVDGTIRLPNDAAMAIRSGVAEANNVEQLALRTPSGRFLLDGRFAPVVDVRRMTVQAPLGGYKDASLTLAPGTSLVTPAGGFARVANLSYASESTASRNRLVIGGSGARLALSGTITAPYVTLTGALLIDGDTRIIANIDTDWVDQATGRISGSASNPTIAIGRRRSGVEELSLAGRTAPGDATWIDFQSDQIEYGASDEAFLSSMGVVAKGALRDGDTMAAVLGTGLIGLPLGSRSSSGLLQAGTYTYGIALGSIDLTTLKPGYVFRAPESGGIAVEVTRKAAGIVLPSEIRTIYGEALSGLRPTGIIDGDVVEASLALAGLGGAVHAPGITGAGRYTASPAGLTGSDAENYILAPSSGSQTTQLIIDRRAITITPTAVTRLYGDDLVATGSFGVSLTSGVAGQSGTPLAGSDSLASTIDLSSLADRRSGVGGYELLARNARFLAGDAGNYAITFAPGALSIDPAPLTLSTSANTKIYGEADPALIVSVQGIKNDESLASVFTAGLIDTVQNTSAGQAIGRAAGQRAAGENVGTYAWTGFAGLSVAPNYVIAARDFTAATLTVSPRSITITPQAVSRVYGDDNPATGPFTVALTAGIAGQTGNAIVAGDALATSVSIASDAARLSTNDRAYDLVASNASFVTGDIGNYRIAYATGAGMLSITRRPVTFSVTPTSFTYGDPSGPLVTINGLITGDEVSPVAAVFTDSRRRDISETLPLSPLDTGYGLAGLVTPGSRLVTVRLEGTRAGMYELVAPQTAANVEILRRNLSLQLGASSYTYGDPQPILSVDGLLAGDIDRLADAVSLDSRLPRATFQLNPTGGYSWQLPANVNAARYRIGISGVTDSSNLALAQRYNFTGISGTLTIDPRVVTLLNRNTIFGDTDLSPLFDNVLAGDQVGFLRSAASNIPEIPTVGTYTVKSALGAFTTNPNYVMSRTSYNLTVAPRVVEYSIADSSYVYGNPAGIALITSQPVPSRLGSPVIALSRASAPGVSVAADDAAVGTYAGALIGFGTHAASNFDFRRSGEVTANITVTPRPVTLRVDPRLTYGSGRLGDQMFEAATANTGLVDGETIAFSLASGNTTIAGSRLDAGNYLISSLSFGAEAANYAITIPQDAALTIVPKPVSINLSGGSKLYDGNQMSLGTVEGLVNDDQLGLLLTNTESRKDFIGNAKTHDYGADILFDGRTIFTSGGACLCDLSITGLTGDRAKNYILSDPQSVQYEIRRQAIPVTLYDATMQYGTPTARLFSTTNTRVVALGPLPADVNGIVPILASASGKFNDWAQVQGSLGVVFGGSTADLYQNFGGGSTLLDAGLYAFRLADLGGPGGRNYVPIEDPGARTLTVTRAPLTITLKSDTLYGNAIYSRDPSIPTCGPSDACSMRDDPRPLFTVTGNTFGSEVVIRLSSAANGVFGLFESPAAKTTTTDVRLFNQIVGTPQAQIANLSQLPGGKYDVSVALKGLSAANIDLRLTSPDFIIGPRVVGYSFAPNPSDTLGIYQYIQRFGYVGPPVPDVTLTGVLPGDFVQVVTGVTTGGPDRNLITALDTATPGEYIITAIGLIADQRNYVLANQVFGTARFKITEPITQLAFSGSLGASSSAGATGIAALGSALNITRPAPTVNTVVSPLPAPSALPPPATSSSPAPPSTSSTAGDPSKVDPANTLTLSRGAIDLPTDTSGNTTATSTDSAAKAGAGGGAGGSTSTPVGELAGGLGAQLGANAGPGGASAGGQANLGGNLTNSTAAGDLGLGVGGTAAAAAKISLISLSPSISVSAKATIEAYVELVNAGSLGGGVEGTSTLRTGLVAGTATTSKLEVKNGMLSVGTETLSGAGTTAGAAGSVDLGKVALNAGAQVFSPGVVGLGFTPTVGVDGSTLKIGGSLTIATGFGGIKLESGVAIDTSTAVDALKSFVNAFVDAGLKRQPCETCDWQRDAALAAQRLSAIDPLASPAEFLKQVAASKREAYWNWMDPAQMTPLMAKADNARNIVQFIANVQPTLQADAKEALKPFESADLSKVSGDDVMRLRSQFHQEKLYMDKLLASVNALGGSLSVEPGGAITIKSGQR